MSQINHRQCRRLSTHGIIARHIDPLIVSLPKAELHLHQEDRARLDHVVARQAGRPLYDWRGWVVQHPLVLVFIVPRDKPPESIVLHRATCPAIQQEDGQVYLTVCVPDFTRLMIWQSQYGFRLSIRHCRICKPGS